MTTLSWTTCALQKPRSDSIPGLEPSEQTEPMMTSSPMSRRMMVTPTSRKWPREGVSALDHRQETVTTTCLSQMTHFIQHLSLRQGPFSGPDPGVAMGLPTVPTTEEAVPDTRLSNEDLPPVPGSDHGSAEDEPIHEPEHPPTPATRSTSALDPVTALHYTAPPEETFEQKRQQLNR